MELLVVKLNIFCSCLKFFFRLFVLLFLNIIVKQWKRGEY